MKKTYTLLFTVLLTVVLNAQTDIPQVVPPSPNAAKLVQFDITPTSPYTGKQNLSVPLYTVQFDGAQFPISINYSSGGIKASEEASYVGLGWGLSIGGTISRTVKSLNDIQGGGWLFDDQLMPETYNPTVQPQGEIDGTPTTQHPFWLYISGNGGQKDTEPDIFNYNFMGFSGSFVLPKGHGDGHSTTSSAASTSAIVKLEEDPTKIYFDNPGKFFTITTPAGFVGEFKVKEWVTSLGAGDPDNGGPLTGCSFGEPDIAQTLNTHKRSITTWYLSKVISPNGRQLHFEYDVKTNGFSDYISQSAPNFSEKRSVDGAWQTVTDDVQSCSYTIVEHVYPKRIYSTYNGLDINFTKTARADVSALANYHINFAQKRGEVNGSNQPTFSILSPQRVTGFTVGSTNSLSSLNHTISFSQSYFNNSSSNAYQMKRLKLDGVTIDDQVYTFEYENGANGLPDKSTFGVDYWGYYNGKDNNTSLVPVTVGYTTATNFYGPSINTYLPNDLFYYQTDERKANFNYGKAGLLKKVNYPTGGFTDYEYEGHEYFLEGREVIPVSGSKIVSVEGPKSSVQTVTSSNYAYNGFVITGGSCNSPITINYTVACANFFLGAPDGICDLPFSSNLWGTPAVEVVNASTNAVVFVKQFSELGNAIDQSTPQYNVSGTFSLNVGPGTYFLRARSVSYNGTYAYGGISISYPKSCETGAASTVVQSDNDQAAGGARIKTITNYDGDNSVVAKRRYDYTDHSAGTQFSTGRLMNPLMNFSITNSTGGSDLLNFYAFMSGSVLADGGAAQGSHIGYTWVREYFEGSGTGNNGFRDYHYINDPNVPGFYGLSAKATYGHSNGQMEDLSNYSSGLTKLDKTDYNDIVEDLTNDIKAVKVDWLGNSPGIMETYTLERHFVTPKEIITETYLTGGTLSQTVNRTYNNRYLLESETNTNSNGNVILKEYKYASDISGPTGVVSGMVNGNFISAPIEQTTKVNGVVESASGILYQQVGNNYLPDKVHVFNSDAGSFSSTTTGLSFGGGYEERLEYKLYDSYGNIREFVNEAGVSTTVLWGYGSVYPVAQIENATYAEVSPLISQSTLDSPGSQVNMRNALDALRNNAAMKNARITTMTYDLGVGMLSQTSPNGIKMFYEYDTYGRLKRIKDQDGNIVKVVEYAYKQIIPNTQQN
ncbi:hypothetical protein BFP97_20040 [Roseivirga sp. 4D4]|uniref:hypothetical protein n=1 Tax=Roseivirga sp. 4D4 TaxID=1889784 RepID=UPI000852B2C2|nr:hypothetical protein [Roseivirga sp. 4D4]OEK03668.1 hypothetical protein BFP97_20040 [Roseivirga sp. 4D4]